jgi:hypothetical protein
MIRAAGCLQRAASVQPDELRARPGEHVLDAGTYSYLIQRPRRCVLCSGAVDGGQHVEDGGWADPPLVPGARERVV